jgi:four helix bundle protein
MPATDECWFDHERLEVYQEAIAFIAWLSAILEETVRIGEVKDQLDRASTSISLNIAEGNGKYAPKDRCRFFDIARGSAFECAAGLDILVAKAKLVLIIHTGCYPSRGRVRFGFGSAKLRLSRIEPEAA